jgi:1,4-alpha-glucan branching enzyme
MTPPSPVFSRSPFSAYPLSEQTSNTMAHSLKWLLLTLENINNTLKGPPANLTEKDLKILTERKTSLELEIEQLKGKLGLFKAELPASDISSRIMQKEGIFRAAEHIHFQEPSTPLDILTFQKKQLANLRAKCQEKAPIEEFRLFINTLPPSALEQLYFSVWLHCKTPFIYDFGKNTLLNDPSILMEIKDPFLFPRGGNIIEQMMHLTDEEIRLEERKDNPEEWGRVVEERKENQRQLFISLFNSPHINQKQLKKLYKRLDSDVQNKVPSPPYFGHGVNCELYKTLGAHTHSSGTTFKVTAPHAKSVLVALRAYGQDKRILPMKKNTGSGIWEADAKGVVPGQTYQYIIETQEGQILRKADPFAFGFIAYNEPFRHESVVRKLGNYTWNDGPWLQHRRDMHLKPQAISIYEIHLPSWRKHGNRSMSYRELADEENPKSLVSHCERMGYTHVELMGLMEHPQEGSWGYQATGFFAPNHKLGTLEDLQYLIDKLHTNNVGVFLDWVPGDFANDAFALTQFDGSPLYEHADRRRSDHPTWGTKIFNYDSEYVRNFLLSNAVFWIREMHFDGFRDDGVASMLYLDYDKKNNWLPNHKGGYLNLGALWFMRDLNTIIHRHFPGVIVMAEESSGYPNVTASTEKNGLEFDAKWAMGWENDILKFLAEDYPHRSYHYDMLVHTVQGVEGNEQVILPLSHDEVAHAKKSIIGKMPGTPWQKFANARLLFSYQFCRPGRKLSFMGNELGQMEEWSYRLKRSLESPNEASLEAVQWDAVNPKTHPQTAKFSLGLQKLVQDLNHFYRDHPALWQKDGSPDELSWIDAKDKHNQVISYHRADGMGQQLACVHNFSPNTIENYVISFPDAGYAPEIQHLSEMREVFNSDALQYGGSGITNKHVEILRDSSGKPTAFKIRLAPLATMVFKEKL